MGEGVTDLFGIRVPSTSPLFLTFVGVHILVGLAAVVCGAIAIFSKKGRGRHARFGVRYYWTVIATLATAAMLTAIRFAENLDVTAIGGACLVVLIVGRTAARRQWAGWVRWHIASMGSSYVLLLTAFYAENGAHLPLWNLLPPIAYWLIPTAVGAPIIAIAIRRHPLALRDPRAS